MSTKIDVLTTIPCDICHRTGATTKKENHHNGCGKFYRIKFHHYIPHPECVEKWTQHAIKKRNCSVCSDVVYNLNGREITDLRKEASEKKAKSN